LIKRYLNKQAYGLTTPLITMASGSKMGKTETGAVWLDKKLLSSYDYWQFWRNSDDRDVIKFLKMFTDLSIDKIDRIKNHDINELKIILANEATTMLHGKNEAIAAEETAKKTFQENSLGENLPSININLKNNLNIIDLILLTKFENSKSEIRRLLKGNGVKINNTVISDDRYYIKKDLFNENNSLKLSIGKKKHFQIKLK